MNENTVTSKKMKFGKSFIIVWIVLAVAFGGITFLNYNKYSNYKDAQDKAINLNLLTYKIAGSDTFSEYDVNKDRKELVKAMYDELQPYYPYVKDYSTRMELEASTEKVRDNFYKILKGYNIDVPFDDADWSDYYFQFYGFFDYVINNRYESYKYLYTIWFYVAGIILIPTILYLICAPKSIIIDGDKVICKSGKKTKKEFFIKDVQSVDSTALKGLKITGMGIKYSTKLVKNVDEIRSTIMDYKANLANK